MPRLPYLTADEAAGPLSAELERLPFTGTLQIVAHARTLFRPWREFSSAILNEMSLPPDLRQIAVLRVAALSPGADYVTNQHAEIARQLGVEESRIEGALKGTGLGGDDELVSRFTEQVVRDCAPDEATWEAAVARFSPQQIVELLMTIGQYMMVSRITATVGIEPQEPLGTAILGALREDPL